MSEASSGAANSGASKGEPWVVITPMRMEFLQSYNDCLGCVARERKYLMMTDAPPLEISREFVEFVLDKNFPLYAAIIPGPTVIGWCDICPSSYESRAHVGVLGMGIRSDFRGQGIGSLLIERALKHARRIGVERVELDVYSSNTAAIALYRKFEFEEEGIKRRARKVDGVYEDSIMMARYF